MNGIIKTATAALAACSILLVSVSGAFAHDRWRHHKHRRHHQPVIVKKDDAGELIAAGIIGLAIGAIIAGAANRNGGGHVRHPGRLRPGRDYFPPRNGGIYDEPRAIHAKPAYEAPQPWSPQWHNYCQTRYRSFDGRSGTFLGYDGRRHFCVAR